MSRIALSVPALLPEVIFCPVQYCRVSAVALFASAAATDTEFFSSDITRFTFYALVAAFATSAFPRGHRPFSVPSFSTEAAFPRRF